MSETVIKLEDVSVFQQEKKILDTISLKVDKGEFMYLIGKTGSGKSSLLKTLYADLSIDHGVAQVVGYDLVGLHEKKIPNLRRSIGVVFQDFKLLNDRDIYKNLVFVLRATGWKDRKKMKERINTVLEQVGMLDKIDSFPYHLSGGEQQRVAIARALLNEPDLILADEPTGNLDPETSVEVVDLLKQINANGKTVLMATHDYALILRFPAKTLKCENGKIFEVVARKS